ncbi:MAG: metal ABC transporter permease [Phycisphaerales bacterium JB060]
MTLSPGLDLFPLLAAVLAAVSCGLLGNFLVLRRLSLMGDAMSHSVLPGLVIAFMVTGLRTAPVMFLGATLAGVVTVVLVELVKRMGRVEPGAAMGVVFSVMFAIGVLFIERAARNTDLDANCVLHGQLETLAWTSGAPASWWGVLGAGTLSAAPPQVWTLLLTAGLSIGLVVLLFKELRLAAFDPAMATAQGFNASLLHYVLMVFVAGATVASFEAVGSILVIAMLIVPAATARLLTDRLASQILVSVVVAIAAAALGYLGSIAVPSMFGKREVNAAGSMAVTLGGLLVLAAVLGPRYGVLATAIRRARLGRSIAMDDLLGRLYRQEEEGAAPPVVASSVLRRARKRGLVRAGELALTNQGRTRAAAIVRRHRLWEAYLVERAGLAADHVHVAAENLEHLPETLPPDTAATDPHGRPIPPA